MSDFHTEPFAVKSSEDTSSPDSPGAAPGAITPVRRRLRAVLFGAPRNLRDPKTYHHISLIAFLAWVGLGADGLSS
jgi:hypothetical protein